MPPSAAEAGNGARLRSESSPSISSRLISNPTSMKKIAISPSLIHSSKGFSIPKLPIRTEPCTLDSKS